jgi:hypothetical protein
VSGRSSDEVQRKRGPRSKREQSRYEFKGFDDMGWLLALCLGAALSGGAIRVGLTRDMGAVAVGVYLDEEYATEYIRPGDDFATEIREIARAWNIPLAGYDKDRDVWMVP